MTAFLASILAAVAVHTHIIVQGVIVVLLYVIIQPHGG